MLKRNQQQFLILILISFLKIASNTRFSYWPLMAKRYDTKFPPSTLIYTTGISIAIAETCNAEKRKNNFNAHRERVSEKEREKRG